MIKRLDEARTGVILWPNRYDPGTKLLGVGLPVGERGAETAPGRALLVHEDDQMVVQIAHVSEADIAALSIPDPTGIHAGTQA